MEKYLKVIPPYKPLVQMKSCCLPCSILWILHRRGYWIDQEVIAKELRIRLPKRALSLFNEKMLVARRKGSTGACNIIGKDAYLVDDMFRKYRIPLKMTTFKISKVDNPEKFISDNMRKGNDIMLSFNWKGLGRKYNRGHVVVLSEISPKNIITIGDPSQVNCKFWKVPLNRIVKAMGKEYDDNERGFYIFSEK
jgi:hypothetical protein